MKKAKINRREFLEKSSLTLATTAALSTGLSTIDAEAAAQKIPERTLGKSGIKVPVIAFGGGSRFLMYKDEEEALRVLNQVVDLGITYIDTAAAYGDGLSETRIGKMLKTRRKEVFLATKIPSSARTRDATLRAFEQSLKRLQTDRVDLLHLHSLGDANDLAKIEASDGAIKALYELREQKATRLIGMTSHTDGAVMKTAIEHNDLNCVQMALNAARSNKFEELALPAANKKGLGVILMKAVAQDKLIGAGPGKADVDSLIRYAYSLPVSTMVIGMPKPEYITHNVALVKNLKPMSRDEMEKLASQVAPSTARLDQFFMHHIDQQWA